MTSITFSDFLIIINVIVDDWYQTKWQKYLRRSWLRKLRVGRQSCFLLDTKPIPVCGYQRSKRQSDFLGSANYGFCASRNLIWTPKRVNQDLQNSKRLDRWLCAVREGVEGLFHELHNTGRNLERLLAKTVLGLCTHLTALCAQALVTRRFWCKGSDFCLMSFHIKRKDIKILALKT